MRTLTVGEVAKYYREFPFLEKICDIESAIDQHEYFRMMIDVSRLDAESLYLVPRFCSPPNWIGSQDGKYVGHVWPVAFVVNSKGEIVNRLEWVPKNHDYFLKDVIHGDDIKLVVFYRKYHWYHNIDDWFEKGLHTYVGAYSHHEYEVCIYKEPEQGFAKLIEESVLSRNVPINDLISISLAGYDRQNEATAALKELNGLVDKFTKSISADLWKTIGECEYRGMSGVFGTTELRTFVMAGRIMLSFWSGNNQITFIGDESDFSRTGLQSITSSVDQAKFIVQQVIDNWEPKKLLRSESVSLF